MNEETAIPTNKVDTTALCSKVYYDLDIMFSDESETTFKHVQYYIYDGCMKIFRIDENDKMLDFVVFPLTKIDAIYGKEHKNET